MKNLLSIFIVMIIFVICSYGQINIVRNGDFEEYYSCPTFLGQIDSCKYWFSPTLVPAPADYFNRCSPYHGITVPYAMHGNQEAHSGNGYCAFNAFEGDNTNYREYIETTLNFTLQSGKCYNIRFFINAPNNQMFTTNDISCYFSDTIVKNINYITNLPFTPQFSYKGNFPDTTNWTLVSGDIIANGGENYLIIGNFDDDAHTSSIIINPSVGAHPEGAIYIDDVSLIEKDLSALIPHDTIVHPGDSIYLGGQTGIGLDGDCVWYINGVPIDTIAGIWVKPDSSITYVLRQNVCGEIKYDTVNVIVSGVGIGEFGDINNKLYAYPNPAQDEFTIEIRGIQFPASGGQLLKAEIYNIYGSLVKEAQITNNDKLIINTRDLPNGIYYYKVMLGNNSIGNNRIMVIK